jgi:pantothenate kinase
VDHREAIDRARQLAQLDRRVIIGITGPPGCGKSTLAAAVASALGPKVAVVPMDGFHLANAELERLGLASRKGAPETFDVAGYISLLRRIREAKHDTVYAPAFNRAIEEPIAGAIAIDAEAQLIVTEGNYLLLGDQPWPVIAQLVDETWYCDVDAEIRRARLTARHEQFGRTAADASSWVASVDEPNAQLIAATRFKANYFVDETQLTD